MCHAKDFKIRQEMSELWPFYLLFKAHNFAGLLRAYFSSLSNEISTEVLKTSVLIAPKRAS